MRKLVILQTLLSLLLLSNIVYIPVNAKLYAMQLKTDKSTYNVGEKVNISGNVTLDGTPLDDAVAAIEIDSPYGNPYVIRTVQTGEDTSRYWRLNITELYTCDSHGNPQNLFNKGQTAYVAMKIKNISFNDLNITVALYIQYSDDTPLVAYYALQGEIQGQQEMEITSSQPIPSNAPSGQTTIFAGIFSNFARIGGTAYCKEKTASFYIGSTTPPANPQPQYFNITFATPKKDAKLGNYTIYAGANYGVHTLTQIKQFKLILLGDVIRDGIINILDINKLVRLFLTKEGGPNWNPDADLNYDGIVNILDIHICVQNFLKTGIY